MIISLRKSVILLGLLAMAGCSAPAHVDAPQKPMGNFQMGHNIVVVSEPELMPFSRKADDEEWQVAMTAAMAERFGAYEGEKLYHIGVKVEAYALAVPGVPILFTPKSVLVLAVNIWDDAAGEKLNEEAMSFTVFESPTAETMVSSGLTQSKEEQMTTLTENAAKAIQDWILENPEWVGLPPLVVAAPEDLSTSAVDGEITEAPLTIIEVPATDEAVELDSSVITPAVPEEAETSN